MKVAIVFEPDPELGSDPGDEADVPYRLGEFLDSDKLDILIAYREVGEQFVDGSRITFITCGIWEHMPLEQHRQLREALESCEI